MERSEKIALLAKFFARDFNNDYIHIEKLMQLVDLFEYIYNDNRIKASFSQARTLASTKIIEVVLSEDYK